MEWGAVFRIIPVLLATTIVTSQDISVRTIPGGSHLVAGKYIIQLENQDVASTNAMDTFVQNVRELPVEVSGTVTIGSRRFVFISGTNESSNMLKNLPGVTHIESDMKVYASFVGSTLAAYGQDTSPHKTSGPEESKSTKTTEMAYTTTMTKEPIFCTTQKVDDIWGLDRLDQRSESSPVAEYIHGDTSDGRDVNVYVLDSGVNVDDPEFEGRAIWGFTAVDIEPEADLNGHGTHVAGTVGAVTYGVAKKANIVAVKVLDKDGVGLVSWVLKGLEWILLHHKQEGELKSIINLSLSFSDITSSIDGAIQEAIDANITTVAAAGNANSDACKRTPSHIDDVISVGASTIDDVTASFSNWGSCLDIWAPGQDVLSITPAGPRSLSGTSMASPHVAGVVARRMSSLDTKPTPGEVSQWLVDTSTNDVLRFSIGHGTSPNKLVYMACSEGYTPPTSADCASVRTCNATCYLPIVLFLHFLYR